MDDPNINIVAHRKKRPLIDQAVTKRALVDALVKLDPKTLAKNPVMFVVGIGSLFTTGLFIRDVIVGNPHLLFEGQITIWLWFTVLFANFAEALAEGRGKAQADSLRKNRQETMASVRPVAVPSKVSPPRSCARATSCASKRTRSSPAMEM